jgi:hypothetical protein
MDRLGVWDVVDQTPNMKTVGTTWVFKRKDNRDANIIFKARLCAQGFSQTHGVDFSKTFAPTGQLNFLHSLVSLGLLSDSRTQEWGTTRFISREIREQRRGGRIERRMIRVL